MVNSAKRKHVEELWTQEDTELITSKTWRKHEQSPKAVHEIWSLSRSFLEAFKGESGGLRGSSRGRTLDLHVAVAITNTP